MINLNQWSPHQNRCWTKANKNSCVKINRNKNSNKMINKLKMEMNKPKNKLRNNKFSMKNNKMNIKIVKLKWKRKKMIVNLKWKNKL